MDIGREVQIDQFAKRFHYANRQKRPLLLSIDDVHLFVCSQNAKKRDFLKN